MTPFPPTSAQMQQRPPQFPPCHGIPRLGARRVVSRVIHLIRSGLQGRDVRLADGPHKTRYTRFLRWSRIAPFDRIFAALAAKGGPPERRMIEACTSRRTARPPYSSTRGSCPHHRSSQTRLELQTPCRSAAGFRYLERRYPAARIVGHHLRQQSLQLRGLGFRRA